MSSSEIHCIRLCTQLINAILKSRSEFCPKSNVDVEECNMEVQSKRLSKQYRNVFHRPGTASNASVTGSQEVVQRITKICC